MNTNNIDFDWCIKIAKNAIKVEIKGLKCLLSHDDFNVSFAKAVSILCQVKNHVVVTGMGKSGLIGRKISATFASTGTPSFFLHPGEASHGDLGMIGHDDLVVAISNSGETVELSAIISYTRRFKIPLIAITSHSNSSLAQNADVVLVLPQAPEACPHGLVPTTSTTMTLVLGDALAVALFEKKGFTAADFKLYHPGGKLGQRLIKVSDIMHYRDELPLCHTTSPMGEALLVMTSQSFGCVGVLDDSNSIIGIVTDGDLRRNMGPKLLEQAVELIMTRYPVTVSPDTLAARALEIMNSRSITVLFVVEDNKPVGILHVHDLLRAGIA